MQRSSRAAIEDGEAPRNVFALDVTGSRCAGFTHALWLQPMPPAQAPASNAAVWHK